MNMPSTSLQWLSLVGVIWLQSVIGTNTTFPAYSSHLKQLLSISQLQLNYLAFASDAGKLLGFLSGAAAIYLPIWLVLLIGSSLGFIGYGLQYLFVAEHGIITLSYAHVFLLTVLAGNSICWINTVCYIVTIKNFPLDLQVAIGLTTSYSGLSGKIYTVIVDAFFSSNFKAEAYLLLNSVLPLVVSCLTVMFVKEVNNKGESNNNNTETGFMFMFAITTCTGVYVMMDNWMKMKSLVSVIGTVLFLLAPLLIPAGVMVNYLKKKGMKVHHDEEREISSAKDYDNETNRAKEDNNMGEVGLKVKEEVKANLMITRVEFWLYYFLYLCGATVGLVYSNNLGQIAESRGCSATSLVSISSSFGFFGRLLPSLIDYFFSRSVYTISKPALIVASMTPMAGSFFLLLDETNTGLYASTAVIGLCTGAVISLTVTTTAELFGMKNFAVNHNILVTNIPLGSFLFGSLAAFFYNQAKEIDGKCIGMQCYRVSFIIWGCLCSSATLLAVLLYVRTRRFYLQTQTHYIC